MTKFLNISTDNTLGGSSASDVVVASQKAIKEYVDANSGSVDIDNSTITTNSSDELQAVATVNQNTAGGATNPIYDWVGTLAEYNDQQVALNHPEWICFITDDYSDTESMVTNREIGELVYSTIPLVNAGLHLADGALIDGTGVYKEFYEHMSSVYDAGHTSIFATEADWQTAVSTYGKCGKYVLDTTNHTIRLPKIPGFVEGTLTEADIGDFVAAGLPNITGSLDGLRGGNTDSNYTGAFSKGTSTSRPANAGSGVSQAMFDASRSSSIYGNSTTVQPEAIKVYVYVVIANKTKTAITADIDEIATDLNGKVNLDSSWGFPSATYDDLTLGASGTEYTAPADGWFFAGGVSTGAWVKMTCNNISVINYIPNGNGSYVSIQAKKGAVMTLEYSNTNITDFKFVYAQKTN